MKGRFLADSATVNRQARRMPPRAHSPSREKGASVHCGNFWDGRATGEKLGNPAADQAQGPFLNPLEQALNAPVDVVQRVCNSSYGTFSG